MTAADFRRIALSLEGAEEGSHMGAADFRVGGRIFATLAAVSQGYGNLMLTPEQQAAFIAEQPDLFLPVPGGWGKNGTTHIRLEAADEDVLAGVLRTAWRLRIEKNQQTRTKARELARQLRAAKAGNAEGIQSAKQRKAELRERLTNPEALENVKKRYGLDD